MTTKELYKETKFQTLGNGSVVLAWVVEEDREQGIWYGTSVQSPSDVKDIEHAKSIAFSRLKQQEVNSEYLYIPYGVYDGDCKHPNPILADVKRTGFYKIGECSKKEFDIMVKLLKIRLGNE